MKNPSAGRREKLRQVLIATPQGFLNDAQLLELLLYASHPRQDVAPLARNLIKQYGNLASLLQTESDELQQLKLSNASIAIIKATYDAAIRLTRGKIQQQTVLQSWKALIDYCRSTIGHKKRETFRVLFLNAKYQLIADEVHSEGSIDSAYIEIRKLIRRCLEVEASGVIMLHNHPSGDVRPSKEDIALTKHIHKTTQALSITLHDHIIISSGRYYSFRNEGLIE